jgi:hypothetical protein
MPLIRRLAALGAAAEAARRYARNNPEKARQYTDRAARFANERTKGRYQGQINAVTRKLAELGGFAEPTQPGPNSPNTVVTQVPPTQSSQSPRPTPYKRS